MVSQDSHDLNVNHSSENVQDEHSSPEEPREPELSSSESTDETSPNNSTLRAEAKFVDESIIPDDSSSLSASDDLPAQPRNRFASFPSVPASVHSFNPNRPPFLLDPTSGTLNKNPFPLPGQSPISPQNIHPGASTHTRVRYNPNQPFSPSLINSMIPNDASIERKDSPVSPGNMLQMAPVANVNRIKDMAISPNIPPKPGSPGGPGFFSPSLNAQRNYNRIHLNQLGAIWQNRQQGQQQQQQINVLPPRMGPPPHQMIGPVAPHSQLPPQHPPQQVQPQPMGPIHHTSKIYSSASASIPTHVAPSQGPVMSQHQPPISMVGPGESYVPSLHSPVAKPVIVAAGANGANGHPQMLPPKMYAKASELSTKAPMVTASATVSSALGPVQSSAFPPSEEHVTSEKSVLDMVMSAATAWNSLLNEVSALCNF